MAVRNSTVRRTTTFKIIIAFCCAFTLLASGCGEEPHGTGPGKRGQVLALRPAEEIEIGRRAIQEILEHATPN